MNPLISIILPVYNAESTLKRCIDSLLNQTYKNIEIICINDGSTDSSSEILSIYSIQDPRVKVFSQTNSGVSAARNFGIKSAKGEWVTGIDSDDYILPDTYEYCLPSLKKAEVEVVCFGINNNIDGKIEPYKYGYYPKKGLNKLTYDDLKRINVCFWCKLFRREAIERHAAKFPKDIRFEDVGFHYSIFPYISNVVYLPERKYMYMTSETAETFMSSIRKGSKKILDLLKVLDYLLNHFEHHPLPAEMQNLPIHLTLAYKRMFYHHRQQLAANELNDIYRREWKKIVDNHKDLLKFWDTPELILAYNLPIKIADKIYTLLKTSSTSAELLALESHFKNKYTLYKLKALFSIGKRKEKYRQKRRTYKSLITKCKSIKQSILNKIES